MFHVVYTEKLLEGHPPDSRHRVPVSYTHLDVYKRQLLRCKTCKDSGNCGRYSGERIDENFQAGGSNRFTGSQHLSLIHILKKLNIKKCLVVTDATISKLGIADEIIEKTKGFGVEFTVYDGCEPEPPVENTKEALKKYEEENCEGVIGLGGGSSMDVAKAVAMLVTNGGDYTDYVGVNKVPCRCAPLILIPTTSGTGSEVSMFSIMMVNGMKAGVCDQNITAHIALVDPKLTRTVPRNITASTGLDAFCHLLECYICLLYTSRCV